MRPIPLAPLKSRGRPSDSNADGEPAKPRRGRIVRAVRYVVSPLGMWAGTRSIRGSASFIGDTVREARVGTRRDPRFRLFPDGEFDLEATAFMFSISLEELKHRLAVRQRQTAWTAYLCVVLACASTVTWIGHVFGSPAEPGSILLFGYSMLFGAICVLGAFYQALVNYQIRAGRAVGWSGFLLADRGFWPVP